MSLIRSGSVLLVLAVVGSQLLGGGSRADQSREAMQALQEYIGKWKGNGTSEKDRSLIWNETANWSWKFKGKEAFFAAEMSESKQFKSAEMHYVPAKKKYELTVVTRDGKKQVFQGALKKDRLYLEYLDPDTKDTHQVQFNTAADGDRLILTFAVKSENRTLFNKTHQVAYSRDGVTFATSGPKKNECVVTGGLGTSTVSHKGVTYWVCCSGCRDAFLEDPEKYIKEYLERRKKNR